MRSKRRSSSLTWAGGNCENAPYLRLLTLNIPDRRVQLASELRSSSVLPCVTEESADELRSSSVLPCVTEESADTASSQIAMASRRSSSMRISSTSVIALALVKPSPRRPSGYRERSEPPTTTFEEPSG